MRKLIFILLILPILGNAQDVGWLFVNENTISLDKQMHGAGGMYLGGAIYYLFQYKSGNK